MNKSVNEQNKREERLQMGVYALILCLVALILIILSSDQAAQWIYQGF